MHMCFDKLDYVPVAYPSNPDLRTGRLTRLILQDGDYKVAVRAAAAFRSFEDRPWNIWDLYQHLDSTYSDSKFILTERDPESWWRSVHRWLTVSKVDQTKKLSLYLDHLKVEKLDKTLFIDAYLEHNRKVKTYFEGRSNLLVMNLEKGDEWNVLCDFLGCPVPDIPFPHRNRQKYG